MGRYKVGQPEAVEVLVAKLYGRFKDTSASRRLSKAIGRAEARHRQVVAANDRGFYHGLLTGYAVAKQVLEGKLNGPRRA